MSETEVTAALFVITVKSSETNKESTHCNGIVRFSWENGKTSLHSKQDKPAPTGLHKTL